METGLQREAVKPKPCGRPVRLRDFAGRTAGLGEVDALKSRVGDLRFGQKVL